MNTADDVAWSSECKVLALPLAVGMTLRKSLRLPQPVSSSVKWVHKVLGADPGLKQGQRVFLGGGAGHGSRVFTPFSFSASPTAAAGSRVMPQLCCGVQLWPDAGFGPGPPDRRC